jgi:hypothetical protein
MLERIIYKGIEKPMFKKLIIQVDQKQLNYIQKLMLNHLYGKTANIRFLIWDELLKEEY